MKITFFKDEYILEELSILNLQSQSYCVVDLEGSGINYKTEYIIQVGAITVGDHDDKNEVYCSLVQSPKMIPPKIEALTGITNEHSLTMCNNQVIAIKALFTWIHQEVDEVISTDFLLNYYGIEVEDLKRHDALDDCILICRIFREIMNEYKQLGIQDFTITDKLIVKRFMVPGMVVEEFDLD